MRIVTMLHVDVFLIIEGLFSDPQVLFGDLMTALLFLAVFFLIPCGHVDANSQNDRGPCRESPYFCTHLEHISSSGQRPLTPALMLNAIA